MSSQALEMANISRKVNFAQISIDSSKKVIDISSKYTYGINTFKKIVGAVTIIFTDNESSCEEPGHGMSRNLLYFVLRFLIMCLFTGDMLYLSSIVMFSPI